ncbi:MAG: hypothetical protein KBS57_04780 [Alistipes sp.]|nr:hypothetical protein [Candidatus Minthomonas equi]
MLFILALQAALACCAGKEKPAGEMIAPKLISYSLSDGTNTYEAQEIRGNCIYVSVPRERDLSHLTADFTYSGVRVFIGKEEQVSGVTTVDLSDSTAPLIYSVVSESGLEVYIMSMCSTFLRYL